MGKLEILRELNRKRGVLNEITQDLRRVYLSPRREKELVKWHKSLKQDIFRLKALIVDRGIERLVG